MFDLKSVRSSVKVQTHAVRKDRKKESQLINSCCLSFYSYSCIEAYICVNLVLLQSISIQVLNQPNLSYSVFKCGHSQQIWGIWASGETLNFKYKFKVGNPPDIQNICLSFIRILSYESKSLFKCWKNFYNFFFS